MIAFDGLEAQPGATGAPLVDYELTPVCDTGRTVFQVLQYTVGVANPVVIGYIGERGQSYTLSTGTVTAGYCGGGSGVSAPEITTQILAMCDDGTPFYRVAVFTGNNATPTATANLQIDLSTAYTITGTVNIGPCNTVVNAFVDRQEVTTDGYSLNPGFRGYEIVNVGLSDASITIGGNTQAPLKPGGRTSFAAFYDPVTRQFFKTPGVNLDAAGTTCIVIIHQ